MENFPLEPINEIRDLNDVILGIDSLIAEFTKENSELQVEKDAILKQREKDSRLLSTNQMWKARSSYKYQHKTFAEQRANHIESLKTRARDAIMEIELLDNKVEQMNEQGETSAANGETGVKAKVKELQDLYFSVNETFNAIKRLIDESLVDMEDTIQNAAIYEQAKSKLESKLVALEMEYFPDSGKSSRSNTSQSEHSFSNRDSFDIQVPLDTAIGSEKPCARYVLHSTASQPNQLPSLTDLELKDLEVEQVKLKRVMSSVFDKEARDQLEELKQILEEVYPPQSVRDQITYLIETFQKEECAAVTRGEEIEALLHVKTLCKDLQMGVEPPWRRVINPENGLPVYMNDSPLSGSQMSLEHPEFSQIRSKLQSSSIFRGIQFTNYRIGKKATYLQFKLLGNLWNSWENFIPVQGPASTQTVNLTDFLPFIQTLYESITEAVSKQRKSRALDCLYNLFIHVAGADSQLNARTAQCLVIFLSQGTCEQKLARLFRLFESRSSIEVHHQEPMISSIDFQLLLQKILLYTNFLDQESFSEMEECLNSEVQKMSMAWIRQSDFMKWASEAPLIVDWLRCHEEFVRSKPDEVKHQAKCNQCTVYPIEGILFKCQKCPNFDLCDACYLVKAFHHKDTHTFVSIVEPVTANKDLLQGTILRKLSATILPRQSKQHGPNSSFEDKSSTLPRRGSLKSHNRGSTKIKIDPNDPSWTTNYPVHNAQEFGAPATLTVTATQLPPLPNKDILMTSLVGSAAGHVTARYDVSTYNSLRLPPSGAADQNKNMDAVYQPTSAVYASVDNSIYNCGLSTEFNNVNNSKFILPNIPTNRVLGNWPLSLIPPGDEHADIRNLCRTLRGKAPRPTEGAGDGTRTETGDEAFKDNSKEGAEELYSNPSRRDSTEQSNSYEGVCLPQNNEAKNLNDKLSDLQSKFFNLYDQVHALSKSAGVPLQIGSLGEINYDSILSIRFANEKEIHVVHETEILYEMPQLVYDKAYVTTEERANSERDSRIMVVKATTKPVVLATEDFSKMGNKLRKLNSTKNVSEANQVSSSTNDHEPSNNKPETVDSSTNQEPELHRYCSELVSECLKEILALKQLFDYHSNEETGMTSPKSQLDEMALEKFCLKLLDQSFQDALKQLEKRELLAVLS